MNWSPHAFGDDGHSRVFRAGLVPVQPSAPTPMAVGGEAHATVGIVRTPETTRPSAAAGLAASTPAKSKDCIGKLLTGRPFR